jgi:hypothetical protein
MALPNPGYKLVCFVDISCCFREEQNALVFLLEYMVPSIVMFTDYTSTLTYAPHANVHSVYSLHPTVSPVKIALQVIKQRTSTHKTASFLNVGGDHSASGSDWILRSCQFCPTANF